MQSHQQENVSSLKVRSLSCTRLQSWPPLVDVRPIFSVQNSYNGGARSATTSSKQSFSVLGLACSGKSEEETGAAVRAPTAAAGAGAGEYTGADQNHQRLL